MNRFIIESNRFLNQNIQAFYHTDFFGYGRPNNPDYLNILKNDNHHHWSDNQINVAAHQLRNVLITDLPNISQLMSKNSFTVCVVPRAKAENNYTANQLFFKSTVRSVVDQLKNFKDGTNYITRHTNTKTTHLRRPIDGYVNDGQSPYPGITIATCTISSNVKNCDILLVDDIYTKTVNIDECAIQALLTSGARSVTFYAVGQTVGSY